jgi:hypothetical protein
MVTTTPTRTVFIQINQRREYSEYIERKRNRIENERYPEEEWTESQQGRRLEAGHATVGRRGIEMKIRTKHRER